MKGIFNFLAALSLTCVLNSCSSDYDSPAPSTPAPTSNITTYRATLNGSSEVPTNASTATGSATLEYNSTTKICNVSVSYSDMTANGGEIGKGYVGVMGPTIFTFSTFTSPIYYTSVALNATQTSDLSANLYYINLRSSTYTNGEIRGQLIKQTSENPY